MHYVVYFITVPVLLLGGLFGISSMMEPGGRVPVVQTVPAKKLVPTTTAEMAARAKEEALAVEAEFKRRNPPAPVVAALPVAAPADVKAMRKVVSAHTAKKKAARLVRRDTRPSAGSYGMADAPGTLFSFRSSND